MSVVAEEVVVAFPGGVSRDRVPIAASFRSTWLSSSLRALKERGLMDRYLAALPREHHEAVLTTVAGVWLPTAVATAHYQACEALALAEDEQIAIGAEVGRHAQGTVLGTAVRLARDVGVTPWTILERLPQVWLRIWQGGAVAIYRLGPKDARLEIAGWPCARIPYLRTAMRGVVGGLIELFCRKAYVTPLPKLCGTNVLAYRISWA